MGEDGEDKGSAKESAKGSTDSDRDREKDSDSDSDWGVKDRDEEESERGGDYGQDNFDNDD